MFDRAALAEAIAAHGPVARVVVAGVQGSAPREVGAAMLVWPGGQAGTIGGGALEYAAAARARDMLARGPLTGGLLPSGPLAGGSVQVDNIALGPSLGQCCGGAVRLVSEVFAAVPEVGAAFVRPVQSQAGAGAMPLGIVRAMAAARQGRDIGLVWQDGWLIEGCSAAQTPVWIWGAGHVGRALVGVMAPLPDMAITWVDTDIARYPADVPARVRLLPAPDMPRAVGLAPVGAWHVIVTFSHAIDLALCDAVLRHGFGQCGLIGSASKWARFGARLASLGHRPAEIARITCPIGAPNLGKHPQAIAIGVAARMMQQGLAAQDLPQEARA